MVFTEKSAEKKIESIMLEGYMVYNYAVTIKFNNPLRDDVAAGDHELKFNVMRV